MNNKSTSPTTLKTLKIYESMSCGFSFTWWDHDLLLCRIVSNLQNPVYVQPISSGGSSYQKSSSWALDLRSWTSSAGVVVVGVLLRTEGFTLLLLVLATLPTSGPRGRTGVRPLTSVLVLLRWSLSLLSSTHLPWRSFLVSRAQTTTFLLVLGTSLAPSSFCASFS